MVGVQSWTYPKLIGLMPNGGRRPHGCKPIAVGAGGRHHFDSVDIPSESAQNKTFANTLK